MELSFLRGSLLVLVVTWVLMQFGWSMIFPYWSPFLRVLGASPFVIGLILSASNIALFISRIPGAYIADIYGRKKIISIFTFAVGFVQLIYVFALDWRFILLGTIFESLFLIYQPAMDAMVADLIPEDRRGRGYAVVQLLPRVAAVLSPAIGAFIVSLYGLNLGMRLIFLFIFVIVVASGVLRYLFLEETLDNISERVEINVRELFFESFKSIYESWRDSPKNLKAVILVLMISAIEDPIFINYASLYVFDVVGLSEFEWGLLITIFMSVSIIFAFPAGILVDKYGRKFSLLMAYLIIIPSLMLIIFPIHPIAIWIAMVLLAIPSSILGPAYSSIVTDLTKKEFRGRIFGMIGNLNLLAVIVSSPLAGLLYEMDPRYPFITIFATNLLILLIIIFYIRETRVAYS